MNFSYRMWKSPLTRCGRFALEVGDAWEAGSRTALRSKRQWRIECHYFCEPSDVIVIVPPTPCKKRKERGTLLLSLISDPLYISTEKSGYRLTLDRLGCAS
jgi:hypothetical protein